MSSVTFEKPELPKQRTFGYLKNQPTLNLGEIKRLDENASTRQPQLQQDDGLPSGWKPLSLSAPILSAVAILSLLIAAAVEVLAQKSQQDGGLALSPTQDDIPQYAMIFYLYGPNVVAVLYSLVWSWIDLDTKRMQPWFELSKPEGATAGNSLFLDYPYEFVAFVPWKAAKKKHWPVFLSGLTMMLVFWVVTPLQSAVLGLGSVKVVEEASIVTRSKLIDVTRQSDLLDPRVLNNGYAVGWLGQPFPPFVTPEYGLLPFHLDNNSTPKGTQRNVTGQSTKIWTDIRCWPATVAPNGPAAKGAFDFLNGQGCNATVTFNLYSNYTMLYIGYQSSPYSDFALMGPSCPATSDSQHQFLAIWAKTLGHTTTKITAKFNITAMFCQPSYYKQKVELSIPLDSLNPLQGSMSSLADTELLTESEFNATAFEFLLANGMPNNPKQLDYPFNSVVEQHPRLADTNLTRPVSNMVGFALAGKNFSTDDYGDPGLLSDIFLGAHRYLFSLAVDRVAINHTDFTNHTAKTTSQLSGILVSRYISAAVEAVLFCIAMVAFALLWQCRAAPSNLMFNPSSITRVAEVFRSNQTILKQFSSVADLDESFLVRSFQDCRFRLSWIYQNGIVEPYIDIVHRQPRHCQRDLSSQKLQAARPVPLRHWTGGIFIFLLFAIVVSLGLLQWQDTAHHGLRRPSDNFEVLQLLENYLPTVLATFIESFWILLNRLLCTLQPFRVAHNGNANQNRSVDTTYTAVPPQLVVRRALKNSHFFLASVCIISLMANVLSVGLGALFNESDTVVGRQETFVPSLGSTFNSSSIQNFEAYLGQRLITTVHYQDHCYIAMANMTLGTPLPPWTSANYFFQPYQLYSSPSQVSNENYQILTRGFGVQVDCTPHLKASVPVNVLPEVSAIPDSSPCPDPVEGAKTRIRKNMLTRSNGKSSIEYSNTILSSRSSARCDGSLTLAWGRTLEAENVNATVSASFAVCTPSFVTGMFIVNVDSSGFVKSYTQTGKLTSNLDYPWSSNDTNMLIVYSNHLLQGPDDQWHNDTLSRSWMSYLLAESISSRTFIDPHAPVPDPRTLTPTIESIYSRLFSILLSQNAHLFEPPDNASKLGGWVFTSETRIFLDKPAFYICMIVLALNIGVAVAYYAVITPTTFPRLPSTIGSILAYIAPSRAIFIYGLPGLGMPDRKLSYGRYVGKDGKIHVGIELAQHISSYKRSS